MTGIIFTGHGTFASGMHSAVSLLAGESDSILSVDFPGDNVALLKEKLQAAISILLQKQCQQILILCDILSGSPFHTAVTVSQNYTNISIIYGIHLALAVELCLNAESSVFSETDLTTLLTDSREMTGLFCLTQESNAPLDCTDEGI